MAATNITQELADMHPHLLPAELSPDVPAWTQTVTAFLAEKERRSESAGPSRATPECSGRSWARSGHLTG